ncbi:MAG: low temperature requirement protein A [Lachnospiraceae bacterium]|nr:low temperature requirement protein A [Lachnospiraceae bacterium]
MEEKEKKVEYIELIYDLIFVYIIGRNNSLLHHISNGFIDLNIFLTYILTTLIVLQIWYSMTLYINRYGENDKKLYIGLFISMYLLYYMAEGTRVQWQDYFVRYNIAWCLIVVILAILYIIRLRQNSGAMPWEDAHIRFNIYVLLIQAVVIGISIPLFHVTGIAFSPIALFLGIVLTLLGQKVNALSQVDFPHLTERVMLYVVFTFGEMIIGISGYFEGGVSFNSIYFSLLAFLIVAGLFLSYGFVYDRILDRNMSTIGTGFMMIHIFLIAALNNITTALEFMREEEVALIPKNVFLVGSFLIYFVFLFLLEKYALSRCRANRKFFIKLIVISIVFVAVMLVFYKNSYISIAMTMLYVYAVYALIYLYWKKQIRDSRSL